MTFGRIASKNKLKIGSKEKVSTLKQREGVKFENKKIQSITDEIEDNFEILEDLSSERNSLKYTNNHHRDILYSSKRKKMISNFINTEKLNPPKITSYKFELQISMYSSWDEVGGGDQIGLTEIEIYDKNSKKLKIFGDSITLKNEISGGYSDPQNLINGEKRINNPKMMWKGFQGVDQKPIILTLNFQSYSKLLAIRIWNYNDKKHLEIGVKQVEITLNRFQIYKGVIGKGTGNLEDQHCTTLFLTKSDLPSFKKGSNNHFVSIGNLYSQAQAQGELFPDGKRVKALSRTQKVIAKRIYDYNTEGGSASGSNSRNPTEENTRGAPSYPSYSSQKVKYSNKGGKRNSQGVRKGMRMSRHSRNLSQKSLESKESGAGSKLDPQDIGTPRMSLVGEGDGRNTSKKSSGSSHDIGVRRHPKIASSLAKHIFEDDTPSSRRRNPSVESFRKQRMSSNPQKIKKFYTPDPTFNTDFKPK